MELDTTYSQGDRVTILVVSLFSLILFFRIHLFITIIPFECWEIYEIWESDPYYLSPFALYASALVLYFLWGCIEIYIAFRISGTLYVKFISVLTLGTVAFLLFGFFHFWQYLQIERNVMPREAYFWKISKTMSVPENIEPVPGFPSWQEFIIEERCKKGFSISTLTQEERIELRKSGMQ